jgi:hypothetical protein
MDHGTTDLPTKLPTAPDGATELPPNLPTDLPTKPTGPPKLPTGLAAKVADMDLAAEVADGTTKLTTKLTMEPPN